MELFTLGLSSPDPQLSGLEAYWSREQAYCSICLKTRSETTLIKYNAADFFNALQVVEFYSPWVCRWCCAKLKTFHNMRSKALRTYAFLNHVRLGIDHIQNNVQHFSSEVEQIKYEVYAKSDTITTNIEPKELPQSGVTSLPVKCELPDNESNIKRKSLRQKKVQEIEMVVVKKEFVEDQDVVVDVNPHLYSGDQETPSEDIKLAIKLEEASSSSEDSKSPSMPKHNAARKVKKKSKNNIKHKKKSKDNIKHKKKSKNNIKYNTKLKTPRASVKMEKQIRLPISPEEMANVKMFNLTEAEQKKEHGQRLNTERYANSPFKCDKCALCFAFEDSYNAHMRNHSKEMGEFMCDICEVYVATDSARYQHRLRHFRRYACRSCGYVGKDGRSTYYHYVSHHKDVSFTCGKCNKTFKRPGYLKKHLEIVHNRVQRTPECVVCKKTFSDPYTLKCHMRQHTEASPQPPRHYECADCGKVIKYRSDFIVHVRSHTNRPPVWCGYCMKSYKTDAALQAHITRLHTAHTWKYQCDDCGKLFYRKPELRNHILWTHGRQNGHDCTQCDRKFRTNYLLQQHIAIIHDKIKPARDKYCDVCGKGFADRQVLRKHKLYVHEGEKKHRCPDCGASFQQRCDMRKHYKVKHLNIKREDLRKTKQVGAETVRYDETTDTNEPQDIEGMGTNEDHNVEYQINELFGLSSCTVKPEVIE